MLPAVRIIAGEFRGRRLLGPASDATRPVTDRAKQSIFDILDNRPDRPETGLAVADVFCGTGSFGLESLSRGAAAATFFDADKSALARLRRNIATLGVADRCAVRPGDLFRLPPAGANRAHWLFFDPPYRLLRDRPADLQALARHLADSHLAADGLLIFRHDAADALDLPGLAEVDARTFGQMRVRLLKRQSG